jgi:AcrR family transcriptional regulator
MASLPTRTSPRQARSARSLDLILDAAERLFHDRGVAETSTVDVASAAKVSVGRLYYWFPDKDAITQALMQRAEQRLRDFLDKLVVVDPEAPAGELLDRVVPMLGAFFREHPGSLAVLMRGPVDPVDHGGSMCDYVRSLAAAVLEARVPGIPDDERDLVAATITRIVIGMMADHVRADLEQGNLILLELRYVLAAYLHSRYPAAGDPVWDAEHPALVPVRPSARPPRSGRPVTPALMPQR